MHFDGRTCRTPAEHRAAIATAGVRRGDVLSWPTAERLRHDRYRLGLLVRWRDLMEPARIGGEPDPADDGKALVINRTDRPTVDELLAAAFRSTYTVRRHARGQWQHPVHHPGGWFYLGDRTYLGALVFHNAVRQPDGPHRGELVHWGTDKHGRPLTPYEKLTLSSRGGRRKTPSGTRQRKAVDTGGDWDGLHHSPDVSLDEQGGDAFDAVARQMEAHAARKAVGPNHADVLDMATSSATARAIGEIFGYCGKYAERKGIRLIDDALAEFGSHLMPEADNDNNFQIYEKIAA